MKKIIILTIIFALTSVISISYGQNMSLKNYNTNNAYQEIKSEYINLNYNSNFEISNISFDSSKMKSPIIGGGLSALIPGAGQFYAKKYVKTGIFLAVEAGLWIMYSVFQGKGNDQTTFFQNYADANWDVYRYAAWLKQENFTGSGNINLNADKNTIRSQINQCEQASGFSHQLPNYGDQQYYEVIGKYQTYICGWVESVGKGITKNNYQTTHLTQVSYYMDERQRANTYYDRGTTTLMVVILNHIVSAVDGFISVNSYNNKLSASANVSFAPIYSYKENRSILTPFANIKINF